jgi:cytochrome c5
MWLIAPPKSSGCLRRSLWANAAFGGCLFLAGLLVVSPVYPYEPEPSDAAPANTSARDYASVLPSDSPKLITSDRYLAHQSAALALQNLSLYSNGIGMFATPVVSKFFFGYSRDPNWKGRIVRNLSRGAIGLYSEAENPLGYHDQVHEGVKVVVTGCATCHSGRVLGREVAGLGNKNIDPYALGRWIEFADTALSRPAFATSEATRDLRRRSLSMAERLQEPEISNLTQGMVAVANVGRWFYEQNGLKIPAGSTPAAVKVPALWGYGKKVEAGLFCDGMGYGHNTAWAAVVELTAGNTPENIRRQFDRIEVVEKLFGNLLPPAYPLPIDKTRARQGKLTYEQHCQQCHGTYERDTDGWPVYQPPLHFPIAEVQTDADRLSLVTPGFLKLVNQTALRDRIRPNPHYVSGYFAPRLEGIWARFPYLHNGSVPNLKALLTRPDQRPKYFELTNAGEADRYDAARGGLTVPPPDSDRDIELRTLAAEGARDVYDTSRIGHSNQGHAFGIDLSPVEKSALIEYLKTL